MSNSPQIRQQQRQSFFNELFRRLEYLPPPEVEDSLLLRVLVQAMVAVGILATDVASEVAQGDIAISIWAIPLSIVGGTWSWYRRRDRNVPMKFLIAIGMLGAMAYFFKNLANPLNDTRLVLAQLLIQLQVLHSFDLPRRKDLGYSIVIGLILMAVAANISQTMAFAPLLLLFLVIALPVLVLDYRSRLKLPLQNSSKGIRITGLAADLSWRRLGVFLLVILTMGLSIFAALPRFPGYQLRSFPVTAPSNFQDRIFPNKEGQIVNPRKKNKQNSTLDQVDNKSVGAGTMDDTFYYGFGSKMNQNLRGQLKPQVLLRIRSQIAGFWRVLAFDRYTGQGWEISRDKQLLRVNRPGWSYKFLLSLPGFGTTTKSKEIIQTYTVISDMPSLIPALSRPEELYFPTNQVEIDPEGGLRSPGILPEGLTYTVISQVPYRNRTLLAKAETDYPQKIKDIYLQIPPEIADKVQKRTEEIFGNYDREQIEKFKKPLTSNYEKALFLADYLKKSPLYKLQKSPPFLRDDEDLVSAFLFGYKDSPADQKIIGGYGDHFSTVLTMMLRSVGIPSRLVGGFAPGQYNPFTGLYIVRNVDAYVMTEVYFPKYGWFAFDPIPGHELIPPSIEEEQTFTVLQHFWKWIAGILPSPVSSWLNYVSALIFGWLILGIAWLWGILSNGWIGLFTGIILAIGLGFLGWLLWTQWRSWRYRVWLAKLPPMESLYQQMLSLLGAKGFRKHPAQTPLEYARDSYQHHSPELAEVIDEISQAYVRWRYGFQMVNVPEMRQKFQVLRKRLVIKLPKK